jgi:hypothetical protein
MQSDNVILLEQLVATIESIKGTNIPNVNTQAITTIAVITFCIVNLINSEFFIL